jgi:hypothetical protein
MISFNRLEVLLEMWLTLSVNEFNNVAGIGKHHPKTIKVVNDLGNGLPLTLVVNQRTTILVCAH